MMFYSLALYCPDLTDDSEYFVPVGVLVVEETAKRYSFKALKYFLGVENLELMAKAVLDSMPEIIEQKFEDYLINPRPDLYRDCSRIYYGFISQIIDEWSGSNIFFSKPISMPAEGKDDVEERAKKLFKELVLGKFN